MKEIEFDHINSHLVVKAYEELSNFLVENLKNNEAGCCVVYCTSNGLYFPNTKENFLNVVYEKNRFEWKSKKYNLSCSGKNIYLRDVYKQWYVEGLNKNINSIDKIVDLVDEVANGRKLITIGSSSGGYLATIIGCKLSASHVFNFSGQFDLGLALMDEDLLVIEHRKKDDKYYNIVNLIKDSKCDIFYFSSKDSREDREQRRLVDGISNIYIFLFPGDIHGVPLKKFLLKKIINLDKDDMLSLYNKYKNRLINNFYFELDFLGIKGIIYMYMEAILKKIIKKCKK